MQKLRAEQSYHLPQLSQYIESVRIYRNKHQQNCKELLFEGYPEGVFELIIQSDRSVWQKNCNDSIWRQRDDAFVSGLHQQSFQLKVPPKTEFMSVRFKHGAFKYLFSGRLNDFVNQIVPITDLWSSQGKLLQAKFKKLKSNSQKILALADFIDSEIDVRKHSVIDESVQSILSCHGMIDMTELEKKSHLSTAQFRKRFREEVGLPPKKYAKVIKINAILAQLERKQGKQSLTEIVYDFGYFDQSHFIKDFRAVIGKPPSQFNTAVF